MDQYQQVSYNMAVFQVHWYKLGAAAVVLLLTVGARAHDKIYDKDARELVVLPA